MRYNPLLVEEMDPVLIVLRLAVRLIAICVAICGLAVGALVQGAHAQGFNDGGGFNGGGGFGATNRGFNTAGFNSAPLPALGQFGASCGRMLVPAASLAAMSRGFADGHAGLDLVAETGSPVRAAAAGVVSHFGRDDAYGNFVDIRHVGGVSTRYAHLSAFAPALTTGIGVLTGSVIGQVGSTGRSTGPHLHFEVRIGGAAVDPKPFLVGDNCPRGAPPRRDNRGQEILEARDIGRRNVRR